MIAKSKQTLHKSLRSINLGYKFALVATASLCLAFTVVIRLSSVRQRSDIEIINLAGRERMLSERVKSTALLVTGGNQSAEARQALIIDLKREMMEWRSSHEKLVEFAVQERAPKLIASIKLASAQKLKCEKQVRQILEANGQVSMDPMVLRNAQHDFAKQQEQVINELEELNLANLDKLADLQSASTGLMILALIAQGIFLFRPLVAGMSRSVDKLEVQNDELESMQEEMQCQNDSLIENQAALSQALTRSDDMARLSRFAAARFEELFTGLPIAAFTFDGNGLIFEWNREAESLFGLQSARAMGSSLIEVLALPENVAEYKAMISGVFQGDHLYNIERKIRRTSGESRRALINAFPLRDPEGNITGGVCSLVDVTEQRIAEERLKNSERRFRGMVEDLPAGAILIENGMMHINRHAELITGYMRSEIRDVDEWFEKLHPSNTDEVKGFYLADRQKKFPTSRIVPIVRKDGEKRQVEFTAYRSDTSEIWLVTDITERIAADERFRVLFEHSSDAHLFFDESGIVECNEATVRLLGCDSKAQLLSIHPAIFSPERQPDGRRSDEKCLEMDEIARRKGYHRFEWMHRKLDGTDVPVEVSLTLVSLEDKPSLLTVWHDLTERKAHENAMRIANEKLQRAQAIARTGSWECDESLENPIWSDEMYRILGRDTSSPPLSGDEFLGLVLDEDRDSLARILASATRGQASWEAECRFVRADGDVRTVVCTGQPSDNGRYVGTLQDVTEARAESRRIAESESLFRTSMDSLHAGFAFMNSEGKITMINPKGAEILGLTVDQVLGKEPIDPDWGSINEDLTDLRPEDNPLAKAFRTQEPLEAFVHGVKLPNGEISWISVNAAPVIVSSGREPIGAVASFTDISEVRQQQEMLMYQMVQTNEQSLALEMQKIELEMMNEKLEKLSFTDGLTGLTNHRRFQEELEQEFVKSKRSHAPLSIILLDVDKFKTFNDEFGHQAGDEVLRDVAKALQSAARESDTVARYGGEEFVIILPNTDQEGSIEAAERFRTVIEDCEWSYRQVTVSLGMATFSLETTSREEMIRLADEALYESKRAGRNRATHSTSLSARRKAS